MSKLLTVSIAAYNVEKTIEKCLNSFLGCKHLIDLEILVINDGSSDSTADIVSAYEKQYPYSIRLINKENGGHGSTLNKSLELASGKFYKAVDGDDWVDAVELDKLCDCLEKTEADLVVDDYQRVYPDHTEIISIREGYDLNRIYNFDEIFYDKNYGKHLFVLSNSTIRTDRLRHVGMKIQEHCFYADTELYFYIGLAVQNVQFLEACVYQYRLGREGQSVSAEGTYKHIEDLMKIEFNLMNLYIKNISQIKSAYRKEYLFTIIDTRYTLLFNCYARVILKSDKDTLFIQFLQDVKETYPVLQGQMNLPFLYRFVETSPKERFILIRWVRGFKKTRMFDILRKIKQTVNQRN